MKISSPNTLCRLPCLALLCLMSALRAETRIEQNEPPVISHIPVGVALVGQPVPVHAQVTDTTGTILKVTLTYALSQQAGPLELPMKKVGENGYSGVIPANFFAGMSKVWYFISAVDSFDERQDTTWYPVLIKKPDADQAKQSEQKPSAQETAADTAQAAGKAAAQPAAVGGGATVGTGAAAATGAGIGAGTLILGGVALAAGAGVALAAGGGGGVDSGSSGSSSTSGGIAAGVWEGFEGGGGNRITASFTQSGTALGGSWTSNFGSSGGISGGLDGNRIAASFNSPDVTFRINGIITGSTMSGSFSSSTGLSGPFSAQRR